MTEIGIQTKRTSLAFLLVGAFSLSTVSVWVAVSPTRFAPLRYSLALTLGGALFGAIFGIAIVLIAKKALDTSPGLIINEHGITDNSHGVDNGTIEWDQIVSIRPHRILACKFLKPEDYINRCSNWFSRLAMKATYKTYGSPYSISCDALAIEFDELEELIVKRFSEA